MNRIAVAVLSACAAAFLVVPLKAQQGPPPPVVASPAELAQIRAKSEQIETIVAGLKSKRADASLIGDVAVYAHAGRMLLEFPELFANQMAIDRAMETLDSGVEKARALQAGQSPWTQGNSRIYAYTSEIDGSVQPYHVSLPANYDPAKPARLYVWLHGRQNTTTEAAFIWNFDHPRPPGNAPVADQGQIQIDLFGRINSAGWHWAGEADVFEAIAAVKKRFKIDEKRVLLRGFSMGGEGGWHIALHYPDRFAAAELGAGTWSRRPQMSGLPAWQVPTLNIWENMEQWALNAVNLPIAGHGGDRDDQIPYLPGPAPQPNRGQLESSMRVRTQLEREGYQRVGEPNFLRVQGTPSIFLISANTGHSTSPLVRTQLDAFLKEWGDRGQVTPDHIRFVTYTTRYNKNYWVTVDAMGKLYERADVNAARSAGGKSYAIRTTNVERLVLTETTRATSIAIDGQMLKVKPAATITLRKTGTAWRQDRNGALSGLHKVHALQGPIDDAFLEPFLLVRPTGTPWNSAVNEQAMRTLARFDRLWAKFFRGHPFVKDDKDVTAADITKYHLVLFGDPGSNKVMARLAAKLPVKWTKQTVTLGAQTFPAAENFPALVYPNPLNAKKYVVVNTGLTIAEHEYNGDYGMPLWGDYAIVKANAAADVPDLVMAGHFDNNWRLPK
jgi:pimeloyl-ACP methyl ester carboxylesterase